MPGEGRRSGARGGVRHRHYLCSSGPRAAQEKSLEPSALSAHSAFPLRVDSTVLRAPWRPPARVQAVSYEGFCGTLLAESTRL